MADNARDLAGVNLTSMFYSLKAVAFPVFGQLPQLSETEPIQTGELYDTTGRDRASILGTDVIMSVKLGGEDLPDSTVCRINGGNKIIETDMNGQDGTFKELWSKRDFNVAIRGMIIQNDGTEDYPDSQVRAIRDLLEATEALEVVCAQMNVFGITHLAIYDYDFPEWPGYPSVQPFEIMCKSDKLFELELKTGGNA